MVVISAAVEGSVDEAVVTRLILEVEGMPGSVYGKNGKALLRTRIGGYNNAARHSPWVVLVDLDQDADCAPDLCRVWLPARAPKLCFRAAVREVEAWLLADREHISKFLAVPLSRVPHDSEAEDNPKQIMVSLAGYSRRRDIREDMVPRPGSGRPVGPAYTSRLTEFVNTAKTRWRPNVAANYSDSLSRCLRCLKRLVQAERKT